MAKIVYLSLDKCNNDSYHHADVKHDDRYESGVNIALKQVVSDATLPIDFNKKNSLIVTGTKLLPKENRWVDISVYHEESVQVPTFIADDSGQLSQLKALYIKLWDKCRAKQIRSKKLIVKDVVFNLPSDFSDLLSCPVDDIFIVKADFHAYGVPTAKDETTVNLHLPPKYLILKYSGHRIYWITDELSKDPAVQRLISVLEKD